VTYRTPKSTGGAVPRNTRAESGAAALEFALIVPVMFTLLAAVFDLARGMIVWQELNNAAQAVALAAEKLSVTPGSTLTSLTYGQMQTAMSSIYPAIPGLNQGAGTGIYPGQFSVSLAEVSFTPLCADPSLTTCTVPQTPTVLWSTFLQDGAAMNGPPLARPCGAVTYDVGGFPNSGLQLISMTDPNKVTGATPVVAVPQIVADLRYVYTPYFLFFIKPQTFWASATAPAPLGGTAQGITVNATPAASGYLAQC
jgi:Flp pilus assembly pilin Flp